MTKISSLNAGVALTALANGDLLPVTDISDTTEAATGTTKPLAWSTILAATRGTVRVVSLTTDTLTTADANGVVIYTSASAITVTLPAAADIADAKYNLLWLAATGTVTVAVSGTTINGAGASIVCSQAAGSLTLVRSAANAYYTAGAIGDLLIADVTNSTATGQALVTAASATAGRTTLAAAAAAQTFQLTRLVETVGNKAYNFILKTAFACTVTNVTTKSLSGTCTLTGAIDGVNLGGTASAVSSTETSQVHSTANAMAVGTDLVFTASANAACVDMAVNVTLTATLP